MTSLRDDVPALVLPPAVVEGAGVVQWVLDDLLADACASAFEGLPTGSCRRPWSPGTASRLVSRQ